MANSPTFEFSEHILPLIPFSGTHPAWQIGDMGHKPSGESISSGYRNTGPRSNTVDRLEYVIMPQTIHANSNVPSGKQNPPESIPDKASSPGAAIYHFSLLTGFAIGSLGVTQLFAPAIVNFFTGFGDSLAGTAIGAQWMFVGMALTVSAMLQYRRGTVVTGAMLLVIAAGSITSHFVNDRMDLSMLLHLIIACVALVVCTAPRRSDKNSNDQSY